ncbi:hypothetical protein Vretifemale_13238, partial [Volvox reticuliferus]
TSFARRTCCSRVATLLPHACRTLLPSLNQVPAVHFTILPYSLPSRRDSATTSTPKRFSPTITTAAPEEPNTTPATSSFIISLRGPRLAFLIFFSGSTLASLVWWEAAFSVCCAAPFFATGAFAFRLVSSGLLSEPACGWGASGCWLG